MAEVNATHLAPTAPAHDVPAQYTAPAQTTGPAQNAGPVQKSEMQKDVDQWVGRINHVSANSHTITNPQGSAAWSAGFFECLTPVDSCLLSCCCPCVMFGRIHHRVHKDRNLAGFSFVNASCLGWYLSACFGVHCLGNLLLRSDIRERNNPPLSGDFATDLLKAWCCNCCDLIQMDKQAQVVTQGQVVDVAPAAKTEQMTYAPVDEKTTLPQ